MSNYNHYINIKDKICIYYEGHSTEYIIQLRMLVQSLESKFEGMEISISCRPQYMSLLKGTNSISSTEIKQKSCDVGGQYGIVYPILYDVKERTHPILDLIKDCKVEVKKQITKAPNTHLGIVCPEGNFPNLSLTPHQIHHLRSWVQSRGFKPLVVGTSFNETNLPIEKRYSLEERVALSKTAGFVVGVECDMLYEAIDAGVPTAIVPTSNGSRELYEAMTEKPIVLGV